MPKIARIDTFPLHIPLKSPLKWGENHELKSLAHMMICVTLSDGAKGYAESTPRPTIYGETQASVQAIVRDFLTPMALNIPINTIADIDQLEAQLSLIENNHTAKGALNMALHHALAQSTGTMLSQLLQTTQTRTRVSYIVGTGNIDTVLQDVAFAYQAGVRVFKVKIGRDLTSEQNTIQELQQAFPNAEYYVDANQRLISENATIFLNKLCDMGILFCEEPLPIYQTSARQKLRHRTQMPIIGDDSCFTTDETARELAFDTIDIVNIKTPRTGFSQSRRIQALAQNAGKGIMIGSQASSLFGCMMSAIFAGRDTINHPTECSFYLKTTNDLTHAPSIINGYISIDEAENTFNALVADFAQSALS